MTKQQVYDGTLKKFVEIEVDIKDSTEQELLNKTSTSKNRRNQLLTLILSLCVKRMKVQAHSILLNIENNFHSFKLQAVPIEEFSLNFVIA